MMSKNISKLFIVIFSVFLLCISSVNYSYADNHLSKKEIVKELKKEITDLGGTPVKRKHLLSSLSKWIDELKLQLEKLKKVEALKTELNKELEDLGEKIEIKENQEIEADEQIIALRKKIEEVKEKRKAKKAEAEKKEEEEKKAEEKKQTRLDAIEKVKKEILFMGETPMSEYEFTTEDEYIAALRKQVEEVKKLKEEEELKINAEIPEWYVSMPTSSETIMYARGSAISADLDNSEQRAVENALIKLSTQMKNRISSKTNLVIKEAGVDADLTLKTEMQRISNVVVKDATIRGYKIFKTKMAAIADGKYRTFVVIEFPVSLAYKNFITEIDNSLSVKAEVNKLKNTDAFKELEQYVAEFTGA